MKIYVASDQNQLGIKLANMINRSGNNCIISDEDSDNYADLVRDIKGSYTAYDLTILITKDPHDAAIEANRVTGIRAAVCKDAEDAAAAISARSNLVVVDSAKFTGNIRDILKSILDSYGTEQQPPAQQQTKQKLPAVQPKDELPMAVAGAAAGAGILGSLKGALGMGDSSNQPPQPPPQPQKSQAKAPTQPQPPKVKAQQQKAQPQPPAPQKKKGKGGFFDSLKDTFGVD